MYTEELQISSIDNDSSKDDKLISDNISLDSLNKSLLKLNEKTTKMKTLVKLNKNTNKFRKKFKKIKKVPKLMIETCDKYTQTINFCEEENDSDEEEILEYLKKKNTNKIIFI